MTSHFWPTASAASARLLPFAQQLSARGWQVEVVTARLAPGTAQPSDQSAVAGIRITRLWAPLARNRSRLRVRLISEALSACELFLRVLCGGKRVVFVSSPPFAWSIVGALAAVLLGRRFVYDVRDIYPEVLFEAGVVSPRSLPGRSLSAMARALYRHALAVVTVTKGLTDKIQRETSKPVLLVPNGFDGTIFPDRGPRRLPASGTPAILVFHGNIGRFQDVESIVAYARWLATTGTPDILIVVAGEGPKRTLLEDAVDDPQVAAVLRFLGSVPAEAIPELLYSAHIGLSLRTRTMIDVTAFPVRVYECLAAGVPVIAAPVGEATAFLEGRGAGIGLRDSRPETLHTAVMGLLKDPTRYAEVAGAAARAGRDFERHSLADDMIERIEGLSVPK